MTIQQATFGGGCFWCIEAAFNSINGVESAVSGYAGGTAATANYKQVCSGVTDHVEVVQITYDDRIISYTELLHIFFSLHDATQLNRQGNDVGTQYRSVIFYHDESQNNIADDIIKKLTEDTVFELPIVTAIEKLASFYIAEAYHQGYFLKHSEEAYCAMVISPKFDKFKQQYRNKLK